MPQGNTSTSCSAGDPSDVNRSIIARLEDRRDLKSRRNELSPIHCLPVEILCIIFSLSKNDTFWQSPKYWTNFSQVSQHWRSIALDAPQLWTKIPLKYPRWAQEMLIRSKMAKLTIRFRLSFETSSPKIIETFRSCLYEMNRIKEIEITLSRTWKDIFQGLPKSAPQLHTFCIRNLSGVGFSIHEDIFYDTECLRHVELFNCRISWDSRLLTGLTRRLTLEDTLKANSSILQFFHALQRMPALTNLDLIDSIPDDSEGPSTYPVVDLPCLRVLRICSGVGALTVVLRHICFPHSAILDLTCEGNQSTQFDFSNFYSVLAKKFLSFLVIQSLRLGIFGPSVLEFHLWTTTISRDSFFSSSVIDVQPQLKLILTWASLEPHGHVTVLTSAFDTMNLPFLTQLQILTENYIDSQTWVKTFGKLPLLDCVYSQGDSAYSFFEALVYKTKAAEKSKTAYLNVPFPKLRYISLKDTFFKPILVDMLLDCLMERCERNAEVQVLYLGERCDISSNDIKRLKEIVVDVIWNGIEEGVSEEDR